MIGLLHEQLVDYVPLRAAEKDFSLSIETQIFDPTDAPELSVGDVLEVEKQREPYPVQLEFVLRQSDSESFSYLREPKLPQNPPLVPLT